jgi:hypothetical protein
MNKLENIGKIVRQKSKRKVLKIKIQRKNSMPANPMAGKI